MFVLIIPFMVLVVAAGAVLLVWTIVYCGKTIAEGAANPQTAARALRFSRVLAAASIAIAIGVFATYLKVYEGRAILVLVAVSSWIAPAALVVMSLCTEFRASRPAANVRKGRAVSEFAWGVAMSVVAIPVTIVALGLL